VIVDCTALPETLIESILFGHTKGAFTNADKDKTGLIARADKGTLLLDEIGELPLATQKYFLRVLQERCFTPVGGTKELKSDFRLISATNRDLDEMVEKGEFRKDLLFRIKTFHIDLPPLRERTDDIKELARHYIDTISERHRLPVKGFIPEFMEIMEAYHWPGNVRELYHTMEKAVLTDPGNPTLFPMHLPSDLRIFQAQRSMQSKRGEEENRKPDERPETAVQKNPGQLPSIGAEIPPLKAYRQAVIDAGERQYLARLLHQVGHDVKQAIQVSGVGQARFYALLKKHGINTKNSASD